MKVTILGCGSSSGVPLIGCGCVVCTSNNPKNIRGRVCVLVEDEGIKILIDTPPDLRQQSLRHNITKIDAILYTHAHADHCHGIDDVRNFNFHTNGSVRAYADKETIEELKMRFSYAFLPPKQEVGWFRPSIEINEINTAPYKPFLIGHLKIIPFEQRHGKGHSLGFRIGNFAYSTDVDFLPEKSFEALDGVEAWVVDCLRYKPAPTHAHLEKTLEWVARIKPQRAVLTHMGHEFDYDKLAGELPRGIEPGYDGLVLEL